MRLLESLLEGMDGDHKVGTIGIVAGATLLITIVVALCGSELSNESTKRMLTEQGLEQGWQPHEMECILDYRVQCPIPKESINE